MLTSATSFVVRTRSDLVTSLIEQISRGDILPGQLLPSERQLAEDYGLSRTMVREALRTLSERRLIDILPGRGSVVRKVTVSDAVAPLIGMFDHGGVTPRYLIEAREMLEATAAAQAALRATDAEIERMWSAVKACNASTSLVDQLSMDLAFHLSIIRAAGNPLVEVMFRAIQPYVVEILLRSLTDAEVIRQGLAIHERIATAIQQRDGDRAAAEMRHHLTLGLTLFGPDIDRSLDLVARDALGRLVTSTVTLDDLLRLSQDG